jgi:hypothetical protein
MAAVVVRDADRDLLREELDDLVPDGWWHTTEELRTGEGRRQARSLLRALRTPDETCILVEKTAVDPGDRDGTLARREVLARLLASVHHAEHGGHPRVDLTVIEEQREARRNNVDRATRKELVAQGVISETLSLVAVSPGTEHLLWLPDLVCSAYRQRLLFGRADLFDEISELTHVVRLS